MTWKEFKDQIESQGVKDSDTIVFNGDGSMTVGGPGWSAKNINWAQGLAMSAGVVEGEE